MPRSNDEANHQELNLLIASLASRCGLIENHIGGNQKLESSVQDSTIARPVDSQDAAKVLSSEQLDLMKSVANELIRKRGSINACLVSLGLIDQDDTQRTMLHARRDPKNEQLKNRSTQLASNHSSRFQVQRFLAKGGIGQVSIAIDKQLNREVAFKEIRSDRTSDKRLHGRVFGRSRSDRSSGTSRGGPGVLAGYQSGWLAFFCDAIHSRPKPVNPDYSRGVGVRIS